MSTPSGRVGAYSKTWQALPDDWMSEGACAGLSPSDRAVFFSDDVRGVKGDRLVLQAKQICWGCPVQAECLNYAMASKPQGVWGATTEAERRAIAKARPRSA